MIPFPIPETPKGPGGHLKAAARPGDATDSPGGTFTLDEESAPKTDDVPRGVNSVEEPEGGAVHLADTTSQRETDDAQVALASESDARELPDRVSDLSLPGPQGSFGPTRSALTVDSDHPTSFDDPKKPEGSVDSHVGSAASRLNEKGDGERGSLAHTETDKIETRTTDTASESTLRSVRLPNGVIVQPQIGTETGTSAAVMPPKPDVFAPGIGNAQSAEPASTGPTPTASEAERTKAGHIETEGTRHENVPGSGLLRPEGRSETVLLRSPNTAPSFHLPAGTPSSLAGNRPETARVSGQNSTETQPTKVSVAALPTDVPETDPTLTGPTLTGTDRHARDQAAPVFSPMASTRATTPGAKTGASSSAEIKLSAKGAPQPVEASDVSSRLQQISNANAPQHELATKIPDAPSNVEASGSVARPPPQSSTSPIPNAVQSDVSQPEKVGAPEKPTRQEAAPLPLDAIPNPSPASKRMDHARAIYLTTAELGAAKANMDDPDLATARTHVGETPETWAAGSTPLVAASGGTMHASATATPAPASIAQSIAHQIGISLPRMPDRPVEIALSPEELGHVRMTLHASQHGMTVAIQADRAETLDLMRRHIDTLAREMHDMGYGSLDFQFSQRDERPQQRPHMLDGLGAGPDLDPIETPIAPAPRATARLAPPQSGLDLRM